MNKKAKTALIATGCLLIAGASFGVTYSYLRSGDEVVNEFTVGKNDIEVEEEFVRPEELKPGAEFTKNAQIKNTGDVPCYVRARADFTDSKMEALCQVEVNTDYWTVKQDDGYYYYKEKLPAPSVGESGETVYHATEYLFGNNGVIQIATAVTDGDPDTTEPTVTQGDMVDFDIIIYAESVGAEDFDEYWRAWGLEEEPSEGGGS